MNINASPGVIPQKDSVAQALACCLVLLVSLWSSASTVQ